MTATTSFERALTIRFAHRVFFTRTIFSPENRLLAEIMMTSAADVGAKALLVVDENVALAIPDFVAQATAWFAESASPVQLACPPLVLAGGEPAKTGWGTVEELYGQIARHGLDRHSYLLVAGGGALLDAAGFAAATAHRGLRHIRLPTTTLSQADGGVGVKNGINAFGKKNFIGTFAPPFAVINDADFLAHLPAAAMRGGLIEAVKVALIRDAEFLRQIERRAGELARFESSAMEWVVRRCAELHVHHIAESGDPFEFGSARPLDFGHWAAHKLEQMSGFTLSHGNAVAIGLVLDTLYSCRVGLLAEPEADRVLRLVTQLGFALASPLLPTEGAAGRPLLLAGLQEFREHLGGALTITLLAEIGRGVEVHTIQESLMQECMHEIMRRFPSANPVD